MNRQGLIIGIAAVGVVLVGIALYVVLGGDEAGDTVAPIRGPERAEEARDIIADIQRRTETQARERPAAPPAAPTTPEPGQGGQAEPAAISGAAAPPDAAPAPPSNELDEAFARAQAFRAEGQMADAQLLYFYAARAGHGRAAFELGSMNDPLHHTPETSLLPDPDAFQAYRWYTAAREAGIAEAATRLDALRNWATAAADKGDFDAERLLLQWER